MKIQELKGVITESFSREERLLWKASLLMMIILAILLALAATDNRLLDGDPIWSKPSKFAISLAIHLATLAALGRLLIEKIRVSRGWKTVCSVTIAVAFFEIVYISLQAMRGRHSHFNSSTTIEYIIYALMGGGSLILVFSSFYLGIKLLRQKSRKQTNLVELSAS